MSGEGGRHCHADGHGPCLTDDCPIAGMGPLRGHLRPCPGAPGPQHAERLRAAAGTPTHHTTEEDADE